MQQFNVKQRTEQVITVGAIKYCCLPWANILTTVRLLSGRGGSRNAGFPEHDGSLEYSDAQGH